MFGGQNWPWPASPADPWGISFFENTKPFWSNPRLNIFKNRKSSPTRGSTQGTPKKDYYVSPGERDMVTRGSKSRFLQIWPAPGRGTRGSDLQI